MFLSRETIVDRGGRGIHSTLFKFECSVPKSQTFCKQRNLPQTADSIKDNQLTGNCMM